MMKFVVVAVFAVLLLLTACCGSRKTVATIQQGISGHVYEVAGNQMPSPDEPRPSPKGMKTTVFVYEPTSISQVARINNSPVYKSIATRMIKMVEADEKGFFAIDLPEGMYSLFVKLGDNYYSNSFDSKNLIFPVTVEKGRLTEVNITVSANATF